jgi:hypothetical protein
VLDVVVGGGAARPVDGRSIAGCTKGSRGFECSASRAAARGRASVSAVSCASARRATEARQGVEHEAAQRLVDRAVQVGAGGGVEGQGVSRRMIVDWSMVFSPCRWCGEAVMRDALTVTEV